ncbi:MAG: RDD family protein [Mycobacterium sp.]
MISSEPAPPDAERVAGIITRGLAAVIDLLVVLLIMGAMYGGLVLVRLVYSPAAFSLPSLNAVFSTVVTFGVAVVYLTGCWTVSGSTAGAVTMGLRVVGRRSQRVGLIVGLLRAVCCVVFPIGLLWVGIDRRRRSVQDIAFRTRVVYSRPA